MSGKQRDQGIRNVLSYGTSPRASGLVRLRTWKIAAHVVPTFRLHVLDSDKLLVYQ